MVGAEDGVKRPFVNAFAERAVAGYGELFGAAGRRGDGWRGRTMTFRRGRMCAEGKERVAEGNGELGVFLGFIIISSSDWLAVRQGREKLAFSKLWWWSYFLLSAAFHASSFATEKQRVRMVFSNRYLAASHTSPRTFRCCSIHYACTVLIRQLPSFHGCNELRKKVRVRVCVRTWYVSTKS